MNNYVSFESYATEAQAKEVSGQLLAIGIDNKVVSEVDNLDNNFVGSRFANKHFLKMDKVNFEKARNFLIEKTIINIEELDKDYLLLQFSNKELIDIVAKPEEWGIYNYKLALTLLEQKGINGIIEAREIKETHLKTIAKGKKANTTYLLIGYTFMILVLINHLSFLRGIIGFLSFTFIPWISVFIGWAYAYSKKTLPDGNRIFNFNKTTRIHGKILFFGTLVGIFLKAIFLN